MILLATATLSADDGLALTPPRAWRSWNQFNGAVTQAERCELRGRRSQRLAIVSSLPQAARARLTLTDVGIRREEALEADRVDTAGGVAAIG